MYSRKCRMTANMLVGMAGDVAGVIVVVDPQVAAAVVVVVVAVVAGGCRMTEPHLADDERL